MPKRKLTKHEDDILRNLRKSAEINPAQSPHDGIHTCSKGCKKPGCNRGLRDTIEEQDAQIEALKQDLLEQTAAVRHLRMERIHDLNHIGGLQEDNARLKAENERLRKACELVFDESAKRKFLMCYRGNDFYVSLEAMEAMSVALGYRKAKGGKPSV